MSERTDPEEIAIPLFEELAAVAKHRIVTGKVQISTVTREYEHVIDEMLRHERVEIERSPIDKRIDAMPAVREEGDTIIIPIVEETLVMERSLVLKEEIRVRRIQTNENYRELVILRRQEAIVTRNPVEKSSGPIPDANKSIKKDKEA
jgi:stress response protein YsnF